MTEPQALGSIIEVFPGGAGKGRRPAAWRGAPVTGTGPIKVRPARLEDYAAIRALQREAHPSLAAWTLKQLESQRHAFAEGQLVADSDGEVVAAASSLVVQWDDYALDHTWKGITGEGYFTTHDRAGRTLYGAEVVVDLARRGSAAARALFQAQRRLCRRLNLRRIISAVRLPGYHAVKDTISPELYAQRVIWGDVSDPNLSLSLSQGFQYCGVIRGYLPEDAESCGNAALVVWLNPLHSPGEPPAKAETERPRKVA